MIGIICPICRQPRRRVYPHLQWARAHNPDVPHRNFRYLQGAPLPARRSPYEYNLSELWEGGAAFMGFRDFCPGHED